MVQAWETEMNCWHCNTELRWCDDVDVSEESEDWSFMAILDCSKCGSLTEVYYPKEKDDDTKSTVSTTE